MRLSLLSLVLFGVLNFGLSGPRSRTAPARISSRPRSVPSWSSIAMPATRRRPRSSRAGSCWIRSKMRKGGQSGPAVVPGKPEESPLVQAVRYDDELPRMPPEEKTPRPRHCRPGTMGQGGGRGAVGSSSSRRLPQTAQSRGHRLGAGSQALGLSTDHTGTIHPRSRTEAGRERRSMVSCWPGWKPAA